MEYERQRQYTIHNTQYTIHEHGLQKELEDIILSVIKEGGSDIHFSANRRPTIRIAGNLIPLVKKTFSRRMIRSDFWANSFRGE